MRRSTIIGLFALLVALAGCNSSPGPGTAPAQPGGPAFLQVANNFRADPQPNRTVADGKMPLKFINTDGNEVDLASYRGKSNVVLVVVKGLPTAFRGQFCPGCLAQVNSLTANYTEFKKRNAEILMVFPGPKDGLPQFRKDAQVDGTDGHPSVPFPLLWDTDLNAVKTLGIDGDWARPATYILDTKGNVVFAYVAGEDTTSDRPSVQALLAQLDKLNAKT